MKKIKVLKLKFIPIENKKTKRKTKTQTKINKRKSRLY